MYTIEATPHYSTLLLNPSDRALGRAVQVYTQDEIGDDDQIIRDLVGDIFFTLFKFNPQPMPDERIKPSRMINKRVIDHLRTGSQWEKSKASTSGSLMASRVTAGALFKHLIEDDTYNDVLEQMQEAQEQEQQQQEAESEQQAQQMAANALQQMIEQLMQQAQQCEAAGDQAGQQQAQQKAQQAQAGQQQAQEAAQQAAQQAQQCGQAIGEIVQSISEALDGLEGDVAAKAAIDAALGEAGQEADDTDEAMSLWGIGRGTKEYGNPHKVQEFVDQNTDQITAVAKVAGRVKGIASMARVGQAEIGVVPTGLDLTDDPTRLLPEQVSRISDDAPSIVQVDARIAFAQNGLLGYSHTSEAKERGPFIFAGDKSGSMMGQEMINMLGMALGMAQYAREDEDRQYQMFLFDHIAHKDTLTTDEDMWQDHMQFASMRASGGTSFDAALEYAKELLEGCEVTEGTDLVFATDGYAPVSQQMIEWWREFIEANGARLIYVPVNAWGANTSSPIVELADEVIPINDLTGTQVDELASKLGAWLAR